MTSDEGGLIEAEYLNLYIVDRVATTGVTWFGMTIGCAQCHDHKYDPVTQKDFYQLYSFFANVPESGKDGVRDRNPVPFLSVPMPEQQAQIDKLAADLAAAQKQTAELEKQLDAQQAEWEKKLIAQGPPKDPSGPWVKIALDADGNGASDDGKAVEGKLNGQATFVEGAVGTSFRTEKQGWVDYGDKFGVEKDQSFTPPRGCASNRKEVRRSGKWKIAVRSEGGMSNFTVRSRAFTSSANGPPTPSISRANATCRWIRSFTSP
jgi:hypothetical protein